MSCFPIISQIAELSGLPIQLSPKILISVNASNCVGINLLLPFNSSV